MKPSKCCLIGVPDHQAVLNVGGRVGAMEGPAAFRRVLARFNGRSALQKRITDLGDVKGLGVDVAVSHRQTADSIARAHREFNFSIVVGGGHDHGFSQLQGVRDFLGKNRRLSRQVIKLGCINIDAHLDVRKPAPLITSGSPFYLAIESGVLDPKRFVEFGIQEHANSDALWEYAKKKKLQITEFPKLRDGKAVPEFKKALAKLSKNCDAIVLSLDLDAAASAFAPGVSAPQAEGFTASEVIEMAELAGANRKVISLGIFELCPAHDVDDRTARLAVTAAYHFVSAAFLR